jgi:hypothetical protein
MRARSIACALFALSPTFIGCGGASSNRDTSTAGSGSDAGSEGSAGSGGSTGGAVQGCDAEVQFASPAIEAAIRQRLSQPDGPLNGTSLTGITDLLIPASTGEVTDLDGTQCLVNLRTLGIPPGSLASLAPLTALRDLRSVSFSENQVTSLAPLGNKPNLRTISASANAIASLSDLTLTAQPCGPLELTENPLTEAAQGDVERFCADGWFVSWGPAGTPRSCNDDCGPRP